jgi:L-asparaginase
MNTMTALPQTTCGRRLSTTLAAVLLVCAGSLYDASAWAADATPGNATGTEAASPAAGSPRILVLATGGTIAGTF